MIIIPASSALSIPSSYIPVALHQDYFASLNYEVKESTSLDNPVVDPNFNTLRNKDMNKIQAIILVGGIILIATLAPLITWWYFSR